MHRLLARARDLLSCQDTSWQLRDITDLLHVQVGEDEATRPAIERVLRKSAQTRSISIQHEIYGLITTRHSFVAPSAPWDIPLYIYPFPDHNIVLTLRPFTTPTAILVDCATEQISVTTQINVPELFEQATACIEYCLPISVNTPITIDEPGLEPCLLLDTFQFAHNLWNELSFTARVLVENHGSPITVVERAAPLAGLEEIFPLEPQVTLIKSLNARSKDLYQTLNNNYFLVPTGSTTISEDLVSQLHKLARQNYPVDATLADAFRQSHHIVLWVSLRLSSRIAINWAQATQQLLEHVRQLASEVPALKVGIIFDGYCNAQQASSINTEMQKELSTALAFIERPDQSAIDWVVLPGANLLQSVIWADASDLGMVHVGTIDHKYWWFTGKPTFVHRPDDRGISMSADTTRNAVPFRSTEGLVFSYGRNVTGNSGKDLRPNLMDYEINLEELSTWIASVWPLVQPHLRTTLRSLPLDKVHYASPKAKAFAEIPRTIQLAKDHWAKGADDVGALFCKAFCLDELDVRGSSHLLKYVLIRFLSQPTTSENVAQLANAASLFAAMEPSSEWIRSRIKSFGRDARFAENEGAKYALKFARNQSRRLLHPPKVPPA